MKIDVETIARNKINWGPIYEVIDTSFSEATKNFRQNV